jgi:calcineurin-like phosphoesterase family protein
MPSVFLVSDTHFGHVGVTRFLRDDGTKLRPWDNVEEMDEEMVKRWNETVRPKDKVYHLGDVVMNRKSLGILRRLNGDKVLIKGNHDIFRLEDYSEFFRDIRAYHPMNGCMLSHVPMHEESLGRFGTNIHGHLHYRRVTKVAHKQAKPEVDTRYHCVCVELTDYRPILFEEVMKRIKEEGGMVGLKSKQEVYGDKAWVD